MSFKRLPALLLPGQGNQQYAMIQPFLEKFPSIVKPILEEADESLKQHFSRLLVKSTDAESMLPDIHLTSNAQPAILTTSYTVFEILRSQLGTMSKNTRSENHRLEFLKSNFSNLLGHSLGEFSAATVAGALEFSDAVKLVNQRGKFMEESKDLFLSKYKELNGGKAVELGMYVVLFSKHSTDEIIKIFDTEIRTDSKEIANTINPSSSAAKPVDLHPLTSFVELGNINSNSQIVFSGPYEAVKSVLSYIQTRLGLKRPFKTIPLKVSAPFHSPVMTHAQNKMKDLVGELQGAGRINFSAIDVSKESEKENGIPLISNITARPFSSESQFLRSLAYSCTDRVYWYKSIVNYLHNEQNVSSFVALAPGNVADLTKRDLDPKNTETKVVNGETLDSVVRNWS